ncbi:DUF327 domain-containing protein [Pueribacillus theae]|uniref:DUF327 domain-containing protein n=1 Tax=Pueribacillus theae TaxID=2171751 RepID=A0A2U1K535_9BACI|nr:YaaR family protein [Pueribacillus theae]PWA12103.1 DUF327 domain-containing protein [Pueribacillus theae]
MKIGQDMRPLVEKTKIEQRHVKEGKEDFQVLLRKENEKTHKERLKRLLFDIEKQGEKLARSQTIKELHQYKQLVERFVKEAVHFGMNLKHSSTFSHSGKMESHILVEKIDEELLNLATIVLDRNKQSIDLMGKIGEIKGLLINLYT